MRDSHSTCYKLKVRQSVDQTLKKWLHGLASSQMQPLKDEFYAKLLNIKFKEMSCA